MRIGLFGGTFNPIHLGHLRIAEEIRQYFELDKVIFIPTGNPPLKFYDVADAHHRFNMVSLSISDNPFFDISDIEIYQTKLTFTIDTIMQMLTIYSEDKLFFIVGIDAFIDLPKWKSPEKLLDIVDFIVVSRPGYNLSDMPYINNKASFDGGNDVVYDALRDLAQEDKILKVNILKASLYNGRKLFILTSCNYSHTSSNIRQSIRSGISIRYLVHDAVINYINANKLYLTTED